MTPRHARVSARAHHALAALGLALSACSGTGTDVPQPPAPDVGTPAADAGTSANAGASGHTSAGAPSSPTLDVPNLDVLFEESCATATARATLLPANLLFVLDRSASMACNPPPTTDPAACEANSVPADPVLATKWQITTGALLDAIAGLPPDARVAVSYFNNDGGCGVNAQPTVPLAPRADAQLAAVRASLDTVEPAGATPLVGATILAYRYLHGEALAGRAFGPRFVVLVTDGEQAEACTDPARCTDAATCTAALLDDVARATAEGVRIRTFVVGVPGSASARTTLSRIAQAGGTARAGCDATRGDCHHDVSDAQGIEAFQSALARALEQIHVQAITCELPLPRAEGGAFDPTLLNVVYTPGDGSGAVLVVQDTRACVGGANGWQYTPDGTRIVLCGSACRLVRSDAAARVDVVLGCATRRPQ